MRSRGSASRLFLAALLTVLVVLIGIAPFVAEPLVFAVTEAFPDEPIKCLFGGFHPVEPVSARVGAIEQAEHVQQGRFPNVWTADDGETGERVVGDRTEEVPLEALAMDDVVLVRPGARVPVTTTSSRTRSSSAAWSASCSVCANTGCVSSPNKNTPAISRPL